jgi:hypothetical protein
VAFFVATLGRDEFFFRAVVFGVGAGAQFFDVALAVAARFHTEGAGVEVKGARPEQ